MSREPRSCYVCDAPEQCVEATALPRIPLCPKHAPVNLPLAVPVGINIPPDIADAMHPMRGIWSDQSIPPRESTPWRRGRCTNTDGTSLTLDREYWIRSHETDSGMVRVYNIKTVYFAHRFKNL
jgi:hypothetical protein